MFVGTLSENIYQVFFVRIFFLIIPPFLHTYIWGKERGREGERGGLLLLLLSHFSRVRLCVTA